MGYRQVTREELEDYVSRNPGAKYRVDGQEYGSSYEDEQGQSKIMKLLMGLSKPLRTVPASAYSAITGNTANNPFLTQREQVAFEEDPTKFGTKQAASLGSFLVPGGSTAGTVGKRIIGAAAKGAGAGALGGFSMSDDENELESILRGAGIGGVLGGGLQAAGEGVKTLKNIKSTKGNTGEVSRAQKYLAKQRGEAIGLDPNKLAKGRGTGINSATEGDRVISDFFGTMDELGLPTRTSNIASESADQALSVYGNNFNELLSSADNSVVFNSANTKSILDRITKEVGNNPNVMKSSTVKELMTDLVSLGDNYTPSQLNSIREKARGMINWSRSSNKMPMTERGVKSIFDSIDDFFKSSIPESGETLSKMKNIYTVRPYIQGKAQLGDVIKVGTASTNIAIPTAGVNEAIQGGVGKMAQGVRAPGGADLSALSNILGTAGNVTQRVAPAMASQLSGQAQAQPQMQPMGQTQYMPQTQQLDEGQMALRQELANAVYSGQITASDLEAIQGLLGIDLGMGGQGGPTTEGQRDYQLAAEALSNAYNLIDDGAGKLPTLGGNIAGFFGSTTGSSEYRASLDTAISFLRKALIGSGQSEAELANLNLPKPTDEPAIAKQKIEALMPLLYGRAGVQSY